MSIMNCGCRRDCTTWALIVSGVVGVVAAFLTITGVLALAPVALAVALGIGVVYLAGTLVIAPRIRMADNCCCRALNAVLVGALGTVAGAAVLLAVAFAATSVLGAIITGIAVAAFALLLTATACLVRCLAGCAD